MIEETDRILPVNIEEEMKSSYIDYSMSVIVARALPDVRDGFKPVHRRILYGMDQLGITHDKPTKKSARIVGEVLGKYHPHGDSSVYGALVRMAQDWNMRYPLVEGQGNFGSMDGDGAAAMRYTEARLAKLGEMMMQDIEKETVEMVNNFDDSLQEPSVLPTRIPSYLVNGATGIAVGMATNVPTHNLSEVIDGCVAYIDNPDIDTDGLMQHIKGPDFPTGATILGTAGIKAAYETGRGRVVIRAKAEIENGPMHDKIVVNEVPYGVNKAELCKTIAELVNDHKIEGISNVNDESDREGLRIVIDVKRDANASVVLNKLYKLTALQSSFAVNNIALVPIPGTSNPTKLRPKTLTLKDCIRYFVEHRHDVVIRRTQYDLRKAEEQAHLLEALIVASDNIDEVVHIIRAAKTPAEAVANLMKRFDFDEPQAKYVVEMRLRQLTGLQQDELRAKYDELLKQIEYFKQILADPELCKQVMKDELVEVKEKYGDERRTDIQLSGEEFNPEDFYANDEVVVTVSHLGYIKRTPLSEFRAQSRGGQGSKGSASRDGDFIEYMFQAKMHDTILFFTTQGKVYKMRCFELPEGNRQSKGRAIQNMLNLENGDSLNVCINIWDIRDTEFINTYSIVFCTRKGVVKKTSMVEYQSVNAKGKRAITIREDDAVVSVCLVKDGQELLIATAKGRANRFKSDVIRQMGRVATGVRGITLDGEDDSVVGMICVSRPEEETAPVVSSKGYAKRSHESD
ncbi:MAG: DNA gyrase subunit A [Bacteroidaceae bacterium]|nr:DNA gyrase subunit A [Bacteroidaceae bacterium]